MPSAFEFVVPLRLVLPFEGGTVCWPGGALEAFVAPGTAAADMAGGYREMEGGSRKDCMGTSWVFLEPPVFEDRGDRQTALGKAAWLLDGERNTARREQRLGWF